MIGGFASLVSQRLDQFDAPEHAETAAFQRRLYTIEELAEVFEAVGLGLTDVYDEPEQRRRG